MNEKDLIAGTIEDLKESLGILRDHRDALNHEIEAKEIRLTEWQKRLQGLGAEPGAERPRSPKGANLRSIANVLASRLEGATASEIRSACGLAWSSVQRTLGKHTDIFEQVNGLWRLNAEAKKKFGGSAMPENNGAAMN